MMVVVDVLLRSERMFVHNLFFTRLHCCTSNSTLLFIFKFQMICPICYHDFPEDDLAAHASQCRKRWFAYVIFDNIPSPQQNQYRYIFDCFYCIIFLINVWMYSGTSESCENAGSGSSSSRPGEDQVYKPTR